MVEFKKATRTRVKLRLALIGPSGSGKTMTALQIAKGLGEKIALIDTEQGSASLYSDVADFDVLELTSFAPERYIEAIRAAEQAGYDVLIIDSLSHAWAGKDGILEFVDAEKARNRGNDFGVWRKATPLHNQLVDAILAARMHVIVTMRSKVEYVIEKDAQGKSTPRKIGMQPIQRDGLEYEFSVVADMDHDHQMIVTKSRFADLQDAVIKKPGPEVGQRIIAWLNEGALAPDKPAAPAPQPAQKSGPPPWWSEYSALCRDAGVSQDDVARFLKAERATGAVIQQFIDESGQRDVSAALRLLVNGASVAAGEQEAVDA